MLIRPLQLLHVLAVTGLRLVDIYVAIGFAVIATVWYSWSLFVPPNTYRAFRAWSANASLDIWGKLGQIAYLTGMMGFFLIAIERFDWSPVPRWFASFGTAYYLATVLMGFFSIPTMIGHERRMRRILSSEEH